MSENVLDMTFTLPIYIDFRLNDFIILDGEKYKLNISPTVEKKAKRQYDYTIQFEQEFYDLAKIQLQGLNPKNSYLEPTFNLMGNAATIVGLVVENINRSYPGWTVGIVDDTEYKNFSFSAQNCLQVLHQLASDFNTELWIDHKTIHLQKREQSSGLTFAYGQGNGLYNILRQNKTNTNIVTRLYVRGSSDNLPIGYRNYAGSLLLPGGLTYIQDDAKVDLKTGYGLIEATQVFDIKPEREGTITSIVAGDGNWKYFTDSSMDFDVNQFKLADAAKIIFNTGQLAGYTFVLGSYNPISKTFTINKNDDEKSLDVPSNLLRPAVGDKYVIVNIGMPPTYVTAAENRLQIAGRAYYDKNSNPDFLLSYSAKCDRLFIKQNNVQVVLGNTAVIHDEEMGLNPEVRIASYVRDLQDRSLYESVEWSDTIGASEIVRQYAQQQRTLQLIESSGILDINQIRKNIFLNRLSESNGYLLLGGTKVKAGVADYAPEAGHALLADYAQDSDKWDGRQFDDYLNQPVRKTDAVKFLSVVADTVNSALYISGFTGTGYKINPDGSAEFDSLTVRKELNVNVLNVREITGSGGSIAVTNVAKIKEVTDNPDYWSCQINTDDNTIAVQFRINDIVRCQVWDGKRLKYYTARVRAVSSGIFDLDKTGKTGAGIPAAGDSVFQFGNTTDTSRQGLIYLTNSDTGAPYLDVLDGINSDSLASKTKVRLGKLSGINDPELGQLDGYGLYADRAFIKGKIVVTGGNAETVTGSQAKANTAQSNAISTAQADAQAKANTAQTAAAGYTDSKSQATLTAAQSYADSTATSKSNAAQANAIYQASADAQAKANAAQANAAALTNQLLNSLKVGGRNLFKDSTFKNGLSGWNSNGGNTTIVTYDGKPAVRVVSDAISNGIYSSTVLSVPILANTDYCISFDIKGGYYDNLVVAIGLNDIDNRVTVPNSPEWNRVSYVTNSRGFSGNTAVVIYGTGWRQEFFIRNMKIEVGNKPTDWTPAPEDVQAAIDDANSLANQAKAAYSSLTSQLKTMAYRDIDIAAAQGITVIDRGTIVTFKADVAYLRANVANIEYLQGLEFNFTQGTVDRLKARVINATQIVVDGGGATTSQAQSYANTAQINAISSASVDAQNKINAIKVGGRNIFKDSSFKKGLTGWHSNGGNTSMVSIDGKPAVHVISDSVSNGIYSGSVLSVPILANTDYCISFDIKGAYYDNLVVAIGFNDVDNRVTVPNSPVWNRVSYITNSRGFSGNTPVVIYGTGWRQEFFIRNIKIEIGNKPSDWTPAPEDTGDITDNFTVIEGGLISTNTLRVGTLAQANAGLTGVTDQAADSVRIWAGGTFENRYTANFQVRDNGKVIAKNAEISGKIVAAEGNIGSLRINQSGLAAGSENTWTANSESVVFNPSYLLMRKCGSTAGSSFAMSQTREMSFGLGYYPGSAGSSDNHTVVVKNNIRNTYGSAPPDPSFRRRNIAMRLEARDSDENIALEIGNGRVYLNDVWDVNESTGPLKGYVKAFYNSAWGKYVLVLDDTRPHLESVTNNNGLYGNDVQSGTYQKQCGSWEDVGSYETYSVPANTYFAATKAAANTLAMNDVNNNGQTWANSNGYCQYNPR
ncbi:hypothetical protein H7F33_05480 [Pedobacter sp. PAMC26386]|nr:hypothetical protein H7F33_05480 [Pedobacter sp. PAMC26386]